MVTTPMTDTRKILIAEDSIVLGDVIRFNLQRLGFDVTLARNGTEAFRLISSESFEVLVTDYEMPGMDGEELCRRVRTELGLQDIRIVMCSAKSLELQREELKARLRIEEILFKPFSLRDLASLLEKLLVSDTSNPSQLALTT
jgi:CheY-like chemotaxis protein